MRLFKLLMKSGVLPVLLVATCLAPVQAGNLFAEAENVGTVTSVFPETGLIVINGKRYTLSKKVIVVNLRGQTLKDGAAALRGGMNIQFAFDPNAKSPVVTGIIVVNDRQMQPN